MDTAILSGPGRQLTAVAVALREFGVELSVITFQRRGRPTSPFQEHLRRAGVPFEVIPESSRTDVRVLSRLRGAITRFRPHIVQTHSYRPAALVTTLRALPTPWRWIAFFHGVTNEDRKVSFYNWLDRRLLGLADRVVVMSKAQLAALPTLGSRVRMVHNAVLPDAVTVDAAAQLVIPPSLSRPVIGAIGRLSAEKGFGVLLRALRLLIDDGRRCSLVIAGDGPERETLMRIRDEQGLGDAVHFLGPVHPIAPLYHELDVVAIPSFSEGLPNVLLEALAADRPVVATAVGAIPEVLANSDAGELVEPGSAESLAAGLVRALDRLDDCKRREARRAAVDAFSLERRALAHVSLYRELLEPSRVAS